jgi:C-terminal processing protease CtpA/Prc
MDLELDVMRRMRRRIFAPKVTAAARPKAKWTLRPRLPQRQPDDTDFFFAKINGRGGKAYGYIRIWRFAKNSGGPSQFVSEFVELLRQTPRDGLIIDIRNNPGGKIVAGERILQTLTGRRIEPELFQFRNTRLNLQICIAGGDDVDDDFRRWIPSIRQGLRTGDVYSAGFPKTARRLFNPMDRQYKGPVVLITNALSYSAADIFAAGFQDHGIGRILGVHRTTGAGGAQSWFHGNLSNLELPNSPYRDLPELAGLKFALRRSLRVGRNAGKVLEEFGVEADEVHELTRNDVLYGDVDLIAKAISMLE